MKLLLAAIGRLKDDAESVLVARYQDRIGALGRAHALGPLTISALSESKAGSPEARKADEARRLLAACRPADHLIALDETGRARTSRDFATLIAALRDGGTGTLAFALGGPDGHGPALIAAADRTLALGPMTLPHGIARVVLIEQVYRALTIIAGHPYHRA